MAHGLRFHEALIDSLSVGLETLSAPLGTKRIGVAQGVYTRVVWRFQVLLKTTEAFGQRKFERENCSRRHPPEQAAARCGSR